jgi:hypothetical protein
VAAAATSGQPVLVGEAVGRRMQIVGDPDDVVDAHQPPRCTTRSGAKRNVTRTSPGLR